MARSLYLDSARLGRMTPSAHRANLEFVRFAADEVCPPYFDEFLTYGADACPSGFRSNYPGLGNWAGIAALKARLRGLAHSPTNLSVLLANRSAQLMKFAARWLFRPCGNVLVLDATWPAYRNTLENERRRTNRRISTVAIHDAVLSKATVDEIVVTIQTAFLSNNCDGLFLPAVTHDGIRIPVARIVESLEATYGVLPVVVDGAQDFCHTPTKLDTEHCDLYLAGCHKWLGGYYPMGLAFYGRRRSACGVEDVLQQMLADGDLDDPLLRFSNQMESDLSEGSTETVSLSSLFSCYGAALDASEHREHDFQHRRSNADAVIGVSQDSNWRLIAPAEEFRSAVVIMQSLNSSTHSIPAKKLRVAFEQHGVSLTAYQGGRIRLSMPETLLTESELTQIRSAFNAVR